ncbi:N-glycosylase/DNA lyase [Candidatus Micrarchaeota archaeon]|nr:N-glycosylase/DNA lyase [Candidatus Micrarchaeota archaeon]
METLVQQIEEMKKGEVGKLVRERLGQFKQTYSDPKKVFSEMCFCLLTANSSAEMGLKVQSSIGHLFFDSSLSELSGALRKLGYRFYNKRAEYILEARMKFLGIKEMLREFEQEKEAREFLVLNVKGYGYKEASNFLRNIGFMDVAILDRHIIRVMNENGIIRELPASLNRKKYLRFEKKLEPLCKATGLAQGELDFYLWYLKTGKVLK